MKKLLLIVIGTLFVSGCAAYPVYPRYQRSVPYYRTGYYEHREHREHRHGHMYEHREHHGHGQGHHDDD